METLAFSEPAEGLNFMAVTEKPSQWPVILHKSPSLILADQIENKKQKNPNPTTPEFPSVVGFIYCNLCIYLVWTMISQSF